MVYHCYLTGGGPNDGKMSYCFHPYEKLCINGHVYGRSVDDSPEEWVDYDTRRITLRYEGPGTLEAE